MLKVALTGGIASGKSTALKYFNAHGIQSCDADALAHHMLEYNVKVVNAIVAEFGEEARGQRGIDRDFMRQAVFSDKAQLSALETIMHPLIREEIVLWLSKQSQTTQPFAVVDIPLLFEKGFDDLFDYSISIDCSREQQVARLNSRKPLPEHIVNGILDAQLARETRNEKADFVLDNTLDPDHLKWQIRDLHEHLVDLNPA